MDPCWLCQCRGGVSFCSKAECAELDCENFYVPDGECCPVCIDETCPDVSTYCSLECPLGYEKDNYGCEVCECSVSTPKCRPMTCSKTCPYGYMRNKHGCEMCRCVRCPPFSCDKHCSDGYRKSRKGCSVCECKDESGSGQPEGLDLVVCRAPGGELFVEGETWRLDECSS
ncbi:hypothetical protein cypCar_00041389 [Cyprinus carpio]|nr:hypothetical protein cypCar_00041389 [Cyprinus carpio]